MSKGYSQNWNLQKAKKPIKNVTSSENRTHNTNNNTTEDNLFLPIKLPITKNLTLSNASAENSTTLCIN